MNWRWYITGLVLALAFIGVGLEQTTTTDPNQEIVVRFNGSSITSNEAQTAISEITAQLKSIGVEDYQVIRLADGGAKVTYYSTLDVVTIKNLLNGKNKLKLEDTAFNEKEQSSGFPLDTSSKKYNLEVVKIQKDIGFDFGFQGILVQAKVFNDQYLKPKVSVTSSEIDFNPQGVIESIGTITYPNIAILIAHTSNKIPEVRAGPLS